MNGERSLYFRRPAAQFFIAAGNPAQPFSKMIGHNVDANLKKGPLSFLSLRSTPRAAFFPLNHS